MILTSISILMESQKRIFRCRSGQPTEDEKEFLALPFAVCDPSHCQIALRPDNVAKNRFRNALACDHSLVVVPGVEYFNGNYVHLSAKPNRRAIITQAPMSPGTGPGTILDFWRVVYYTNTKVLVMVCPSWKGRIKLTSTGQDQEKSSP